MAYTCPICHKSVKDLKAHTKKMHPEKEPEDNGNGNGGQELEIKEPEGASAGYHCVDCGGSLTKGQNPCPHCGASLDWSGV